jgi:hypothetical protein
MEIASTIVSSLAWPVTILVVGWYIKDQVLGILNALKNQLSMGAKLKYGEIEFHGVVLDLSSQKNGNGYSRIGASKLDAEARHQTYASQKNLMLVHKVKPTGETHVEVGLPVYDVAIYLFSHKGRGALNEVRLVEYYFGDYFGKDLGEYGSKYLVQNGSEGFAVRLTAYGPMLCIAKLIFHDGSTVFSQRYLDFEHFGYKYVPAKISKPSTRIKSK